MGCHPHDATSVKPDRDRIAPFLWIGSKPSAEDCRDFNTVVLCAQELQHIKLPGCHVVHAPLDDSGPPPTQREVRVALSAGRTVHALRKRRKNVLVTCQMGVNRSSLVAALALLYDGMPADKAIRLIRSKRHPRNIDMMPLSNPHFVQLIRRSGAARGRQRAQAPS